MGRLWKCPYSVRTKFEVIRKRLALATALKEEGALKARDIYLSLVAIDWSATLAELAPNSHTPKCRHIPLANKPALPEKRDLSRQKTTAHHITDRFLDERCSIKKRGLFSDGISNASEISSIRQRDEINSFCERWWSAGLARHPLTHVDEGFDFLGQNLRKYDGKALAKLSKKNTHGFLEKVRGIIDANRSVRQKVLMTLLNPVIRGWANYHRHIAAKDTFPPRGP